MSPLNKLYLKTFLITGLGYAILVQFSSYFRSSTFHLDKLIFDFLVFGIIMSLVLVSMHKLNIIEAGEEELTDKTLNTKQYQVLKSPVNQEELKNKLKQERYFSGAKIYSSDHQIKIQTSISWKSFGETIEVNCKPTDDGMTIYDLRSRSKIWSTLVDYGKNLENIKEIEKLLA